VAVSKNGELLLVQGAQTEAERCFREEIAIAREQDDKAQELKATIHLARLLAKEQREQSRTMLAEI
jgi:hypothetical protein